MLATVFKCVLQRWLIHLTCITCHHQKKIKPLEQEWKNAWLAASFTWHCVGDDAESAFWAAAKLRERIGEAYETLYYTPVTWLACRQTIKINVIIQSH